MCVCRCLWRWLVSSWAFNGSFIIDGHVWFVCHMPMCFHVTWQSAPKWQQKPNVLKSFLAANKILLFLLSSDKLNWLSLLNYDLSGLAPPLSWPLSAPLPPRPAPLTAPSSLWDAFTLAPKAGSSPGAVGGRSARSPFEALVPMSGRCVSGMAEALREATTAALSLDTVRPSALREDFWPSLEAVSRRGQTILVIRVMGELRSVFSGPQQSEMGLWR